MGQLSAAALTAGDADAELASVAEESAPRRARVFVSVVLVAMVLCAAAGLNAWPFSDWELFSRLRLDRQTSWAALAVDGAGRLHSLAADSLAHGRGSFRSFMVGFAADTTAERDAVCAGWLAGTAAELHVAVRMVRLYRLTWMLSDRAGERVAPAHRSPRWICSGNGLRAAG